MCDQENERRIAQPSGTVRANSASLESSLFDGSVDHGMVVSPTAHKGHEFETLLTVCLSALNLSSKPGQASLTRETVKVQQMSSLIK